MRKLEIILQGFMNTVAERILGIYMEAREAVLRDGRRKRLRGDSELRSERRENMYERRIFVDRELC